MNANGVMATSTASVAPAAGTTGGTGKTGASGFAGAIVQAMGGVGSSSDPAAGAAVPAGLAGLLNLLGTPSADGTSEDLLKLLAGMTEQLKAMDPNAELSAQLQDQLAALLLAFQNLLTQNTATVGTSDDATTVALHNQTATANQASQTPVQQNLPLIAALQQSAQQLTERLSQGDAFPDRMSALHEQLRNVLDTLASQPSTVNASANQAANSATAAAAHTESATKAAAAAAMTITDSESAQVSAAATPEIRRAAVPFRNPVWHFQADSAAASAADSQTAAFPVESADAAGQNGSAPAWTFLKPEQASISTNSAASAQLPAQVPVQQFADQIGKYLVKQFVLTQGNGVSEARISLHPEHLGQVDIKIMVQNGQLTAQFVTEHGAARDLLENQMSQLRAALQGQGLQVEKMEVVQQPSTSDTASFFQHQHDQRGSGHYGRGSNGRGSNAGVYEDTAGFEAELDRSTSLREIGYGSSLNVTA